jgi:glutathione S-transferase
MPHYKLVSFKLCPFVQRSVITLIERGVPYDIEYIDLAAKPQWFLEISPFGRVPLLAVDRDVVLFESAVINEYLDETAPGRRFHPEDPLRRAHNRMWIEFISSLLGDQYRMQLAPTEAEARQHLAALHDKLGRLEAELPHQDQDHPWFNGAELSLVDIAAAPLLQRARWVADFAPDFDLVEAHPRMRAWQDALLARDSVRRSTADDVVDLYRAFVRKPLPARADGQGDRPSYLGSRA